MSLKSKAKALKKKPAAAVTRPVRSKTAKDYRTSFPVEQVQKLWNEGKSIAEIAKAVGRYDENVLDPTSSFRGSLNVLRQKGILKIGFRAGQKPAKKKAA